MKRTEEQQHKIYKIVKTHVFYLQNEVVELILKTDENYEDIVNLFYVPECDDKEEKEGGEEMAHEIYQWWSISKWLAEQFKAIGVPVLISETYGYWWGRTTCGQSIEQDGEWDDLIKYLNRKVNNDSTTYKMGTCIALFST